LAATADLIRPTTPVVTMMAQLTERMAPSIDEDVPHGMAPRHVQDFLFYRTWTELGLTRTFAFANTSWEHQQEFNGCMAVRRR